MAVGIEGGTGAERVAKTVGGGVLAVGGIAVHGGDEDMSRKEPGAFAWDAALPEERFRIGVRFHKDGRVEVGLEEHKGDVIRMMTAFEITETGKKARLKMSGYGGCREIKYDPTQDHSDITIHVVDERKITID